MDSQRTAHGRRTPGERVNGAPDRVLAAAMKVRGLRKSGKMMAYTELMAALGALDADECARLLKTLAESGEWDAESAIYPLLHWATLDPAAALDFALAHKDFQSSERVIAEMVFALAKTDLDASLLLLSRLEGEEREEAQLAIVNRLVETDLNGALAQARAFSNPKAESAVFEAWAQRDPRAAAAAFDPASTGLHDAARRIAEHLIRGDRAGFDSWVTSLTDPQTRGAARVAALFVNSQTDPALAGREFAAWVALDPSAAALDSHDLPRFIAQRWLLDGDPPRDVAAWAVALPEGASREAAVGSVGEHWIRIDPAAASTWLAELPASDGKDQAITHLVRILCDDSPADAFAWARAIQEADTRREQLQKAARFWHEADAPAAAAAIEALPAEERALVTETLR
ncbi:MAG: hypothetical protein ACKV19_22100 [Verrucomicrobiales bacterium]